MSSNKSMVLCAVLMLGISVLGSAAAQSAQDGKVPEKVPTLGDYNAKKAIAAMAKVDADIAKSKRDADGQGSSNGISSGPNFGGGLFPPGSMNASPSSSRTADAAPTVNYTSANAKGTMEAVLLMSDGNTATVWPGKPIGHGMTVQSITVNDVIVKDNSGVHPLDWTGAEGSARAPVATSPSASYGGGLPSIPAPRG